MTEEAPQLDPHVPQITTSTMGMTDDGIPIELNKLAMMVETWCKEYLDDHKKEMQTTLDEQNISIQKILRDFNQSVLKYLRVGLIASINFGLIGFGWFLRSVLE